MFYFHPTVRVTPKPIARCASSVWRVGKSTSYTLCNGLGKRMARCTRAVTPLFCRRCFQRHCGSRRRHITLSAADRMWERRQELLCMHSMAREEQWQRNLAKKRMAHHLAEVDAEDQRRRQRLWGETKRAVLEYVRVQVMGDKLSQVGSSCDQEKY